MKKINTINTLSPWRNKEDSDFFEFGQQVVNNQNENNIPKKNFIKTMSQAIDNFHPKSATQFKRDKIFKKVLASVQINKQELTMTNWKFKTLEEINQIKGNTRRKGTHFNNKISSSRTKTVDKQNRWKTILDSNFRATQRRLKSIYKF